MAISKKRQKQMLKPSKSKQQSQKKNKEFERLFNKNKQLLKNQLINLKKKKKIGNLNKL